MSGEFAVLGGSIVTSLIRGSRCSQGEWQLMFVTATSEVASEQLYDLWKRSGYESITISTNDLCAALGEAFQVISLQIVSVLDPGCGLLIEDGEIYEDTL